MKQLVTIAVIALIFVGCASKNNPEELQKKADKLTIQISKLEQKKVNIVSLMDTSIEERVYPIKVSNFQKQTIERTVEYFSNLLPWEEIYLAPAAPGRVEKVNVKVGDRVRKGDLIAKMDETQLNQAKIQLAQLEVDFERMKMLRESNSISAQQFDQIKTQLEVLRTNVKFMQDNTKIVAPFNGVITAKYFENGEMYSGAPNTQAGKAAIVTIQQMDILKAVVSVSEKYFPEVKTGATIEVKSDIYPDQLFSGKIDRIYPTIDPLSRSFKVEVKVANVGGKLRPGMYTRVNMKLGEAEAIIAPAIAILQQEGTNKKYIFLHKEGFAKRVDVLLGSRIDDNIEVISDQIAEGDELVVAGQAALSEGYKVNVIR